MKPDNDTNRIVERAKAHGFEPLYWLVIDSTTETHHYVDTWDLPRYERENNVGLRYRISPVFDRTQVNYNGYPVRRSFEANEW